MSEGAKKSHAPDHSHDLELMGHEEHGEGGEEPWLVSYADLMTLLFGFFAMLFTYASFEDEEVVKMRKDVAKYFGGTYVAPEQKLAEQVRFEWGKTPYVNDMDLKVVEDGLEITFITSVLFASGRAELLPEALTPMRVLIELIKSVGNRFNIRVEGHTDDNPIKSASFPSNWELSAARAATIVRLFEESGFPVDWLGATGFGAARPAYPNRDRDGKAIPENQSHNRRVVIKVTLPRGDKLKDKEAAPILDGGPKHGQPMPGGAKGEPQGRRAAGEEHGRRLKDRDEPK